MKYSGTITRVFGDTAVLRSGMAPIIATSGCHPLTSFDVIHRSEKDDAMGADFDQIRERSAFDMRAEAELVLRSLGISGIVGGDCPRGLGEHAVKAGNRAHRKAVESQLLPVLHHLNLALRDALGAQGCRCFRCRSLWRRFGALCKPRAGILVTRDELAEEPHLESVRQRDWFQALRDPV